VADLQKTVEIIFSGRSELDRATKTFERDFNHLNRSVQDATRPLASMADMALKTEAALSAMVVGGMALATHEAGRFGGEFAEITTLHRLCRFSGVYQQG